jgi:hypothetical protein
MKKFPEKQTDSRSKEVYTLPAKIPHPAIPGRPELPGCCSLGGEKPDGGLESRMQQTFDDWLLTRQDLCKRWQCSKETLKRRERSGALRPLRFGPRFVRYALADVLEQERLARA